MERIVYSEKLLKRAYNDFRARHKGEISIVAGGNAVGGKRKYKVTIADDVHVSSSVIRCSLDSDAALVNLRATSKVDSTT